MDDMKTFGKERRLQADSHPDIVRAFTYAALELADVPEVEAAWDRKVQAGPLLNALAMAFVELPLNERIRQASSALSALSEWRKDGGAPDLPVGRDRTTDVDPKSGKVLPKPTAKGAPRSKRKLG